MLSGTCCQSCSALLSVRPSQQDTRCSPSAQHLLNCGQLSQQLTESELPVTRASLQHLHLLHQGKTIPVLRADALVIMQAGVTHSCAHKVARIPACISACAYEKDHDRGPRSSGLHPRKDRTGVSPGQPAFWARVFHRVPANYDIRACLAVPAPDCLPPVLDRIPSLNLALSAFPPGCQD